MKRIRIFVAYDGTNYCGWQVQGHVPSVQAELERALGTVADHRVELF